MINLFLLFVVTSFLTFLYGVLRKKKSIYKDNQFLFKIRGYYLHHSLIGLILIMLPLFKFNIAIFYIGFGIVIGHGFEEIYFGNKDIKTFFTFISK